MKQAKLITGVTITASLAIGLVACGKKSSSSSSASFGIPSMAVSVPASFKAATSGMAKKSLSFSPMALPTSGTPYSTEHFRCTDDTCQDGSVEGRGKEFGAMLGTPQFLMCIASKVWGLTEANYKTSQSFTLDLGAIAADATHPCHGIIELPTNATAYSLKGQCYDLASGDYTYLCKAVSATDGSFALEMAFSITSDGIDKYSGKGYLYSNIGGGGWFKWDVKNGVSTDVWGVKTDTPVPNYWSNYVHIHDDTATGLFTWQAELGADSSNVSGMQGSQTGSLTYQSGVYNRTLNYAKVQQKGYNYNSGSVTAFDSTPWIDINACASVSTTTNRVSGACTIGDSDCNADTSCTAISASSVPDLLGTVAAPNLGYLKKYEDSGLSDGVNDGIRFAEKYSSYTVQ